jgi:hypothetical protein
MHNVIAMQGCQSGQAISDNRDGHTGLESRVGRASRYNDIIDVVPTSLRKSTANLGHSLQSQQIPQVVSIDPFHDENSNAVSVDEIMDRKHIFMLNSSYRRSYHPNSGHCIVVPRLASESLWRKYFHGYRQRESVCASPSRKKHNSLPTTSENAIKLMIGHPLQLAIVEKTLVTRQQLGIASAAGLATQRASAEIASKSSRLHRFIREREFLERLSMRFVSSSCHLARTTLTILAFSWLFVNHCSSTSGNGGIGQSPSLESPDLGFIDAVNSLGLNELAIETCKTRQKMCGSSESDAWAQWTMVLMHSLATRISDDPRIVDDPDRIATDLKEVEAWVLDSSQSPRHAWISLKLERCHWLIERRALAACLAVPARQKLREWALADLRKTLDKVEKLQVRIQTSPERNAKSANRSGPTTNQWINLTNDAILLQADLLLLRAQFYPIQSTERIAAATELLTSIEKAQKQIDLSWSGRPSVELVRCRALLLLDRPQEALTELMKLNELIERPADPKRPSDPRWRERIAIVASETNRQLGKLTDANRWIEQAGGWTASPELAIEYFANLVASSKGASSQQELEKAIGVKSEIGKQFGSYWQQRADAILVSNSSFAPPTKHNPATTPLSSSLRVELLKSEAKQLLAAQQIPQAIDKLRQAEQSASNSKDENMAIDMAIRIAAIYAGNQEFEVAQSEFHRAAMTYRNATRAPDAAIMSVSLTDPNARSDGKSISQRNESLRQRLSDIVVGWPDTVQAFKALASLDQLLIKNEQWTELGELWSKRLDGSNSGTHSRSEADRKACMDKATSRFFLICMMIQDEWLLRTYSQEEYSSLKLALRGLQDQILRSCDGHPWRTGVEAICTLLHRSSAWTDNDLWPLPNVSESKSMPSVFLDLTFSNESLLEQSTTQDSPTDPISALAVAWARSELIFQQILRSKEKRLANDPKLVSALSSSLAVMGRTLAACDERSPQIMSTKQSLLARNYLRLYGASIRCWNNDVSSGYEELFAAQKSNPKDPWWLYRSARIFATLADKREQSIKQFRLLASGFPAGSEVWLEARARTVQTYRMMNNESMANELAELVLATYPNLPAVWKNRFAVAKQ